MREETRNWIRQANKDLGTAGFALNSVDGPLPVTTGLHCQKSAEKYLIAYLHEHAVAISNQPTLTSLLEDCMAVDASFEDLHSDIDQLEGYSIASRYPKAEDSLEFRKEAIATALHVKEFVLSRLV